MEKQLINELVKSAMKKNLDDYRKEMKMLKAKPESFHKKMPLEDSRIHYPKRERHFKDLFSNKWATLMPGLTAIIMAILTLIFLIIFEVVKRN